VIQQRFAKTKVFSLDFTVKLGGGDWARFGLADTLFARTLAAGIFERLSSRPQRFYSAVRVTFF
jgi:hypothetical protein